MTRIGGPRTHAAIGHTADVGMRATAPDPSALLEEAAAALAELMAEARGTPRSSVSVSIEARGDDLTALAYGWLNELVGLSDARGEALVGARVDELRSSDDSWLVRGTASFAPYDSGVSPKAQVKAATFHRLRVEEGADGWSLEAYFDV